MRTRTITLLLLTLGCGRGETPVPPAPAPAVEMKLAPPTSDTARQIVESSPEWSDFQFTWASWSVPLRAKEMNDAHRKTIQELREAGWLAIDGEGNAVLTESAKTNKRFLVRSNATLDIVPLAKKEIVSVSAPDQLATGNVQVIVDWKWIPNEIGEALKSGLVRQVYDSPQKAKATLMPAGGKWTVFIIEPAT